MRLLLPALLLGLLATTLPLRAAIVSYDLSLEVTRTDAATAGLLGTSILGTISFDDALLVGGDATLFAPDFSLALAFDGQTLTQDVGFGLTQLEPGLIVVGSIPSVLVAGFVDGLFGIDTGVDFSSPDIIGLFAFTPLTLTDGTLFGTASVNVFPFGDVAPIPLPAAAPMLLAALGGLALLRRRRRA